MNISAFKVIKSLSLIMDLLSNSVVSHHKKVAYISYKIAEQMELGKEKIRKLLAAALIHDIGVFYLDVDINSPDFDQKDNMHAVTGYYLTKNYRTIGEISDIIRYHHNDWDNYNNKIPLVTNILHLADRVAFLSEEYDIIYSNNKISVIVKSKSGTRFWPEAVQAFKELAQKECFWLNLNSLQVINRELVKVETIFNQVITLEQLLDISKVISYIVDFRSPFTATHSVGIAKVSKELFKLMGASYEEQLIMEIAGYIHDIGKLVVPTKVLNKPAKLNQNEWKLMRSHSYYTYQVLEPLDDLPQLKEWASYHHETLDGQGYPFHLHDNELSQGARIMAVADMFTAMTEDRPYRKGMKKEKVINVLSDLVNKNKIDGNIVKVLEENFYRLNKIRQKQQIKNEKQYIDFKNKIKTAVT
ncbi:MAG: HD domain-containing phosphohydrolase [Halothermotrichaceae bacterium]